MKNNNWYVKNEDGTITFNFTSIGNEAYNNMLISLIGGIYDAVEGRFEADKENNTLMSAEKEEETETNSYWRDMLDEVVNQFKE